MDTGSETDEQDEQIVDLPGDGDDAKKGIELPVWLQTPQSPRQRRARLIMVVSLSALALTIILGSTTAIQNIAAGLLARVATTPTTALVSLPPVTHIYVQGEPPWGHLLIDGHVVSAAPVRGMVPPLHLSPGHHLLEWLAAPFPAQKCTLSIPQQFSSDTCIKHSVLILSGNVYAPLITFSVSLNSLSDAQRAALVETVQAALDSQRSTAVIRPGEYYALPSPCSAGQPMRYQLGSCIVGAQQALHATLSFQLDTDATANLPCVSPEPQQPCAISQQNCHLFCSTDGPFSTWNVLAPVRDLWTFAGASGQAIAQNVPDNPIEESLVTLAITWNKAGWHIAAQIDGPGSSPSFNSVPPCQPLATTMNLLSESTLVTLSSLQLSSLAGRTLADGCLAAAMFLQNVDGTPTPSTSHPLIAYVLYRFGVTLAADKTAHHLWPFLPTADTYEQSLVQQVMKSISAA